MDRESVARRQLVDGAARWIDRSEARPGANVGGNICQVARRGGEDRTPSRHAGPARHQPYVRLTRSTAVADEIIPAAGCGGDDRPPSRPPGPAPPQPYVRLTRSTAVADEIIAAAVIGGDEQRRRS